jgi:hypothetical protein
VGLRPLTCSDCRFEYRRSIDDCLLWELCVVRFLGKTDHSPRGVLPSEVGLTECDLETSTMRRFKLKRTVEL